MSKEHLYDVILAPVITEKATLVAGQGNKVMFKVRREADKPSVKKAVETLFGVTVEKVNILVAKGKNKQFRGIPGRRGDTKKAIVTLAAGQTIDMTAGV